MFCRACGVQLADEAAICPKCGTAVFWRAGQREDEMTDTSHSHPQTRSTMMTLFLSLIWAEVIFNFLRCLSTPLMWMDVTAYFLPFMSMLLAIALSCRKNWARISYIVLECLKILGLTCDIKGDIALFGVTYQIITVGCIAVGVICIIFCVTKDIVAAFKLNHRMDDVARTSSLWQCIIYWIMFILGLIFIGLTAETEEGSEDPIVINEEDADLKYPPIGVEWYTDGYIKVTNKDPKQGIEVHLALGSEENYYKVIPPGGQVDFKGGYWGNGSFGKFWVIGYDHALTIYIKGGRYLTRYVPLKAMSVDEDEVAPISATLDKDGNLTVTNKDSDRGYEVRLELGADSRKKTLRPGGEVVFADFEWHDGTVGILTVPGFDFVLVVYSKGNRYVTRFERNEDWE